MQRFQLVGIGLLATSFAVPVWSQDAPKEEDVRAPLERLMKQFDRDGDGKLNERERAVAVTVLEQFLGRIREQRGGEGRPEFADALKRFDKDGDGKLNDEERAAAAKSRQERMKDGPPAGFNPPEFVIKRFDKDGDGKLNDEERSAAREAMAKMQRDGGVPNREEMVKRFDKDGDGKLNEAEQAAAREEFAKRGGRPGPGPGGFPPREEIIKRFDKDGDGKLNEAEEAAVRAEMQRRRAGGRADGAVPPAEGQAPEAKLDKQELLKKFDKDGDGKLNEAEKAAAREAFQNRERP